MATAAPRLTIRLDFDIDCAADVAWRAIHSPAVAASVYAPVVQLVADTPLPDWWASGDQADVTMSLLGRLAVGSQVIAIVDEEAAIDGRRVRVMRDRGRPTSGPLALLSSWDHRMAVAPIPGDPHRSRWHDRLEIGGVFAPALWPSLWLTWQVRRHRIEQLAPTWANASPS